ncbi:MAG: LysM peptidoglycan-binding domain-containing protein [Planctomycetota bacterium]|nr:LysM peptidoglycan-binding domain-containing protein [Planctomycetota bacterium]
MQVQWNIAIAAAVVVACLTLVIIALAWGKPREEAAARDRVAVTTVPAPLLPPTLENSDPWAALPPLPTTPPEPAARPPATPGGLSEDPFALATPPPSSPPPPPAAAPQPPASAAASGARTHTVAKGETLSDISAQHYGSARHWRRIVEANPGLDPARLNVGQVLQIPPLPEASSQPAAASGEGTYTVKPGESYYAIARKQLGNAARWRELEQLNGIPAEELRAGQVIKLPPKEESRRSAAAPGGAPSAGGQRTHVVAAGETLGDIAQRYYGTSAKWKLIVEANPGIRPEQLSVGQQLVIPEPRTAAAAAPRAAGTRTYVVKPGDTLASIAASQLGRREAWKQIVEANPGIKPEALRVGQELIIPGEGSAAPAAAGAAAPAPAPAASAPAPAPAPTPSAAPSFADDPFFSPYEPLPSTP